ILKVEGLSKSENGVTLLNNISFILDKGDKVAFVGEHELAHTALFKILMEELKPDAGFFKWGVSTSQAYLPKDNTAYFEGLDVPLVEWLAQYSTDQHESYLRQFLGRMLFSGDDVFKPVHVLSGGEKVRCMLSRMMLSGANVLLLDQPTNHLDLESITALNDGLNDFPGTVLFSSHDHQLVDTVANRIMELTPDGLIDRRGSFEEYLANR
ncbi:MAG: ATP-binding cassette domain-containing protein, partial [Eubacteriales bacterium]|nr:ATP-binding cassette domain-containing protein [Eubacteriales bacterium]